MVATLPQPRREREPGTGTGCGGGVRPGTRGEGRAGTCRAGARAQCGRLRAHLGPELSTCSKAGKVGRAERGEVRTQPGQCMQGAGQRCKCKVSCDLGLPRSETLWHGAVLPLLRKAQQLMTSLGPFPVFLFGKKPFHMGGVLVSLLTGP